MTRTLLLAALGCSGPATGTAPIQEEAEMMVKTDLALLSSRVTLPANAAEARWMALPRGTTAATAPGPTDTEIYAWVRFSNGEADLAALPPAKSARPIGVPTAVAQALLPEPLFASLRVDARGWVWVDGGAREPSSLGTSLYQPVFAVWVGDGLLARWTTQ